MQYKFQSVRVKTAPSVEPVTAAQLREELRLDDTSQDDMLGRHIIAARQAVETKIHRTLIATVLVATYDGFPSDPNMFALPRGPYISLDQIDYIDEDGDSQTLASSKYRADLYSFPARIEPAYGETWPTTRDLVNAVSVEYTAGYGASADDVPEAIKQAIKALAIDLYEHPEAQPEMLIGLRGNALNRTVDMLLSTYRIIEVA